MAYDRINPEKGTGKGTKARCDALIQEAKKIVFLTGIERQCFFISTAGYTKRNPFEPTGDIGESLSEQIKGYVSEFGFRVMSQPCAWGTYQEIKRALKIVYNRLPAFNRNVHIWLSTNPGHMPRVKLCWFFLRRREKLEGWTAHFVPANHSFTKKEWFQETAKFFYYLYHFVFKKW